MSNEKKKKATAKKTTGAKKGEKRLTIEDVVSPKAGLIYYAKPGGTDDACKNPTKEESCKNA